MTLWAESFNKFYPNAKIQIEGKGSSTAPPALISGTAQLGPMSREMKGTEIDAVREEVRLQADPDPHLGRRARGLRQQGQPDQVPDDRAGGRDLLEVPPPGRQGGHHDLGPARPHRRVGRTSRSASTAATRPRARTASSRSTRSRTATSRTRSRSSPGSASVVQGVTVDRFAIGYSGIGYATAGVRAVPLAEKEGAKCYEADPDNAYVGQLSAGPVPLRVRQQGAGQAARSADAGVRRS